MGFEVGDLVFNKLDPYKEVGTLMRYDAEEDLWFISYKVGAGMTLTRNLVRANDGINMSLEVGDAVIVTVNGYKFSNQVGIIRNIRNGTAHVMFETGDSSYRLDRLDKWDLPITDELRIRVYRLKPELLRLHNIRVNKNKIAEREENNNMTKLTGFNRIAVITVGYKDYEYALYNDDVKAGDTVIVTGAASDKILEVNKVIEVTDDLNVDHITAEVRGKVDLTAYNERVEKRQRKADLIKKMDKAIAEAKEVDKYTKYAEFLGDDFKAMLNEFKSL